jgi:hypothetical protein
MGEAKIMYSEEIHTGKNFNENIMTDVYGTAEQ